MLCQQRSILGNSQSTASLRLSVRAASRELDDRKGGGGGLDLLGKVERRIVIVDFI